MVPVLSTFYRYFDKVSAAQGRSNVSRVFWKGKTFKDSSLTLEAGANQTLLAFLLDSDKEQTQMSRFLTLTAMLLAGIFMIPNVAEANRLRRMTRLLNLSPQQQETIKNIIFKARRSQISLRANLQLLRLDLNQLIRKHRPNLSKVSALLDKLGAAELNMKKSRIMMMLKIKLALNKNQAEKLTRINERRRRRRMHRRKMFSRWSRKRMRRWRKRQWRRRQRERRRRRRMRRRMRENAPSPKPANPGKGN